MSERVVIFAEGDYDAGTLSWGGQCFACGRVETGFWTASSAGQWRNDHAALCPIGGAS